MECWVALSVHVLLHLVHNVAGTSLGDARTAPTLLVRAHTPTLPLGHPTVTPTHAALRWVPPDSPGRPAGGGGPGFETSVHREPPSQEEVHSGTRIINTHTILRHSRETRETHVPRRTPYVTLFPQILRPSVLQATPPSLVTPSAPPSSGITPPTSWLPRTPVTHGRDEMTTTPQPQLRVSPTRTTTASPPLQKNTNATLLTSVRTPATPAGGSTTAATSTSDGSLREGPIVSASSAYPTAIKESSSRSQTSPLAGSPRRKWVTERRRALSSVDSPAVAVVKDFQENASRTIASSYPLSPVDETQSVNAQLARIWNAGEGEEWRGGSYSMAGGEGPPWSWVKGRRRRRKLSNEGGKSATPPPPPPSTSSATPESAVLDGLKSISTDAVFTVTPYSNSSSEASTESGALDESKLQIFHDITSYRRQTDGRDERRNPLNITQDIPGKYELPRQSFSDGMKVANIYDSVRPGKGTIDFKITKTGDFGGFSVTKTEEVEPISGFSVTKHEEPDSIVEVTVVDGHPRHIVMDNKFATRLQEEEEEEEEKEKEEGRLSSKQGQHLETLGRPPETQARNRGRVKDSQNGVVERQGAGELFTTSSSSQTTNTLQSESLFEDTPSSLDDDGVINAPNNGSTPTSPPTLAGDTTVDVKEGNATHQPTDTLTVKHALYNTSGLNSSKSPSLTHDADLAIPESVYSHDLAQMKLMSKPTEVSDGSFEDTGSVAFGGRGHERSDMTTLSSMFSEDLIPPLPYQWGKEWRSRGLQRTAHDSPRKETQDATPLQMAPDPAMFPFHLPSQIAKNQGESGHTEGHGVGRGAHDSAGSRRYIDGDAWKQESLKLHSLTRDTAAAATSPATDGGGQQDAQRDRTVKQDGSRDESQAVKVRHAPGKADRGSSWPGPGERVEFVTVVPGGHWDVWGGPPLWDSLSPHINHTVRNPQVYSVYWGDTGGPGSPAGWPEGVWVIRGGSLAAIMALVVTISVQVARDGPAHRATPTADALYRAHHAQHATLATNLATSLASAHILLIFGIQATGKAWVCGVVGLLLHFLHLVSCCWLLALTVRLLGSLLHRRPFHTALYCAASWGASLGLVVVSYVVNPDGYETRRYCWMSVERGMLVSFIVPVCTLILVNAGVCVAAQKVLLDMRDGVKHEVMSRHKRDLRGAVSLLPLEGVAWFLGVVALEDHQSLALDCAAALVTATLGWLVLYFHGWSWRCHGLCWLRRRIASRRVDDLSLPLTARYDHDLAHQPLLQPHHAHPTTNPTHHHTTVAVAPPPAPTQGAHSEEFPLQPIFPQHERREAY